MLTTHDIRQSPLTVTVHGPDGHTHTVTVASREAGRVAISCSCASFGREGWCRHVVDLSCMRLRDCGVTDPETDERFEEIVAGTTLESAAHDVDLGIVAYEQAVNALQVALQVARPTQASREALEAAAAASRNLTEATEAASDAIRRLQRKIAEERI
ncbi:MAG TPA: hypothetical protein VLQ65_08270 [Saliniramus sp.]|nr:hypothetical protein [Saliniramus sp.]